MAVLECMQLTKRYGGITALDHINLSLEPGRIVGLVGPNGSGKTTLIKLAQHLLTPTEGQILIGGMEPGARTKGFVSYLPDRDYLPSWMNVESLLDFYQDFYRLSALVDERGISSGFLPGFLPGFRCAAGGADAAGSGGRSPHGFQKTLQGQ